MTLKAHSFFSDIESYKPGKAKINGQKAIKLSSNENALGSSKLAIASYQNCATDLLRYADGSCTALRNAIADKNNINADQIVCGAGSDEIIAFLTTAFAGVGDEVIYSEHGFLMYPISANRVGARALKTKELKTAQGGLKTDIHAIIKAITQKTKIIFIANPNNPTGSYLNKSEIDELISKTPSNILIVLDHAYEEFVEASDYPDAISLVNKHQNVVVTRTFSKIYGLASLRIGWSYSSNYVAEILNKIRGPFNVSGSAQAAAVSALKDETFFNDSKSHNKKWLKIFFEELSKINDIKAHPSVANFILLDFGNTESCQKANQTLLGNNIILREMANYGLTNCLRMTIGTEEENIRVIEILKGINFSQ